MKAITNKAITYRPEIDGLRAVAVLPVIFFHAGFDVFSGGFLGVDVFFVISGYLITAILLKELQAGDFSVLRFYERRARRILPALIFVILCCLPFAGWLMLPDELQGFGQSLISVATFSSNIYFWRKTDYFNPTAEEMPLLHTWSLAVEEQFYVLFPLLLLALWRFGTRRLAFILSAMIITSLGLAELGWRTHTTANFYLLPTRSWELLSGSLIALLTLKNVLPIKRERISSFLAALGLVMICAPIFIYGEQTPFPSVYALAPVLGTGLIISFATSKCLAGRLLASRPLVFVGLISYSAYLWHQPLFAFARIISIQSPSVRIMQILAVGSLVLAFLTRKYVELPFRIKNRVSGKSLFRVSLASLLATMVLGMTLHSFYQFRGAGTHYGALLQHNESTSVNVGLKGETCSPPSNVVEDFAPCSTRPGARILLWGDSFAMHIAQLFESNDLGLVQTTMSSCFPSTRLTPYKNTLAYSEAWARKCHAHSNAVMRLALSSKDISVVVLSSTFTWPLKYQVFDGKNFRKPDYDEWLAAISNDISLLRSQGKKVVIVSPTPTSRTKFDFIKCSKKMLMAHQSTSALTSTELAKCNFERNSGRLDEFLIDITKTADVAVVNLSQYLCDSNAVCSPFVNGELVYRDWGHLSPYGSRVLAREFQIGSAAVKLAK